MSELKNKEKAQWVEEIAKDYMRIVCSNCGCVISHREYESGEHIYCHKCGKKMEEGLKEKWIGMNS